MKGKVELVEDRRELINLNISLSKQCTIEFFMTDRKNEGKQQSARSSVIVLMNQFALISRQLVAVDTRLRAKQSF